MQSNSSFVSTMTTTVTFAIVLGVLFPTEANAKENRVIYHNPTQACQPTDPANHNALRYRPQGLFNASTSSIQIACGLSREIIADVDRTGIAMWVHNFRSGPVGMSCSVQGGSRLQGMNVYPVSWDVPAYGNASSGSVSVDVGTTSYTHYSLSCILRPNTELGLIRVIEYDDGGLL